MKLHARWFYVLSIGLVLTLCAGSIGVLAWAVDTTERLHAELARSQVYDIKKAFLRDTVRNMLKDIDRFRAAARARGLDEASHVEADLRRAWAESPAGFEKAAREAFTERDHSGILAVRLYADRGRRLVFSAGPESALGASAAIGPYGLSLGVDEAWVDSVAKAQTADAIYGQSFEHNGYLWVNEVVDWDGGDGYAIRRIHPNLRDTEGSLLSTYTEDVMGNTPYLTELEGIKRDGELFSRYFFKRMGSDEVSEKLTYAALYPDYGWIVAMGMHVDDLETYTGELRRSTAGLNVRIVFLMALFLVMFFGLGLALILVAGRRFVTKTAAEAVKESNTDPLTGALNRRVGGVFLSEAFRDYRRGAPSPALFCVDLDDFKAVNDRHGHEAGDAVLKAVVGQMRQTMRSSDYLFRWGGEEFIIAYAGVAKAEAAGLAARLNRQVYSTAISLGGDYGPEAIRVSISVGMAWFEDGDLRYDDAIRRGDQALYAAKAGGKNRACMQSE